MKHALLNPEVIKDLQNRLAQYDNSHPKMDELLFVQSICDDYHVSQKTAFWLIKEVRLFSKNN